MIQRNTDIESITSADVLSGLRMTAEEFLQIAEEGKNYELINGVVTVTPSPAPKHQHVAGEVFYQLRHFLETHPIGLVFMEIDVHLGTDASGGDFVYRPEIVFYRTERMVGMEDKLFGPPDLVVEVVSRGSRRIDSETKKIDYERYGVREYWLIDPERKNIAAYQLKESRFIETVLTEDRYVSETVQGFVLDIARVRKAFRMKT